MNTRIDKLETEVAAFRSGLAQIQVRLDLELPLLARKSDVESLRQRMDSEFPHFATKADLLKAKNDARAWILTTSFVILTALGGLQYQFYTMLNANLSAQIAALRVEMLQRQSLPPPATPPVRPAS